MQFKIGQPIIPIMNMFNKIVHHTIKIFKYHPPCRQLCPFAPPITPLMYMSGHDLNSNASLNLDASLSLSHSCYGCTWNSKINKQFTISLSSTHIIIYCKCNKLNSDCCLSIYSLNVNKSWIFSC